MTLTGDMTNLMFSGNVVAWPIEVELHLIQGGAGGWALMGAHAAIRFAGGVPKLSVVAGKRDISKFRYIGGTWYETGRSMNV